jgi:mRNA interferase MazF
VAAETGLPSRGDVFWIDFGVPIGSEPGFRHPAVVVSNNMTNHTGSCVTVAWTGSTPPQTAAPTIVFLEAEKPLPLDSYVHCEQLYTFSTERIEEYVGALDYAQIVALEQALKAALAIP